MTVECDKTLKHISSQNTTFGLKVVYFFGIHMKNVTPASNWTNFHTYFSRYSYFDTQAAYHILQTCSGVQMRYTQTYQFQYFGTSQAARSVEQHIPQVACY